MTEQFEYGDMIERLGELIKEVGYEAETKGIKDNPKEKDNLYLCLSYLHNAKTMLFNAKEENKKDV